jgi:hypothetical protein
MSAESLAALLRREAMPESVETRAEVQRPKRAGCLRCLQRFTDLLTNPSSGYPSPAVRECFRRPSILAQAAIWRLRRREGPRLASLLRAAAGRRLLGMSDCSDPSNDSQDATQPPRVRLVTYKPSASLGRSRAGMSLFCVLASDLRFTSREARDISVTPDAQVLPQVSNSAARPAVPLGCAHTDQDARRRNVLGLGR